MFCSMLIRFAAKHALNMASYGRVKTAVVYVAE